MNKDFIRGGQLTLHNIRMFAQVSKVIVRSLALIFLLCVVTILVRNLDTTDRSVIKGIIKSEFASLTNNKKNIEIKYNNGSKVTISSKIFYQNSIVKSSQKRMKKIISNGFYLAVIAASICFFLFLIFFYIKGKMEKGTRNIRGSSIYEMQELSSAIKQHNKSFKEYSSFTLGRIPYAAYGLKDGNRFYAEGELLHTLIAGVTGTGKTTLIRNLLMQIHKRGDKAIIIDSKGDYIKNFYRPHKGDKILNPLDKRSVSWDIVNETTLMKGFDTIAKSLIADSVYGDQFWSQAARSVFSEIANMYIGEDITAKELVDKILKTDLETLEKILNKTYAGNIISSKAEKGAQSVLMMLSTYLRALRLIDSKENKFSIVDWINQPEEKNFLFLSSRSDMKEILNPIISSQIDIAINALLSLKAPLKQKIWFILDELPYFERPIANLKTGLAMSREFGGCFVLGFQNINDLYKIYGRETAETITSNCRNKVFLGVENEETASWCARCLGSAEIEEFNEGLSYGAHQMRDGISTNKTRRIKQNILPSEFFNLKPVEGFIKMAGFSPAHFQFEINVNKKIAESFIEDEQATLRLEEEYQKLREQKKEFLYTNVTENPSLDELEMQDSIPSEEDSYIEVKQVEENKENSKEKANIDKIFGDW